MCVNRFSSAASVGGFLILRFFLFFLFFFAFIRIVRISRSFVAMIIDNDKVVVCYWWWWWWWLYFCFCLIFLLHCSAVFICLLFCFVFFFVFMWRQMLFSSLYRRISLRMNFVVVVLFSYSKSTVFWDFFVFVTLCYWKYRNNKRTLNYFYKKKIKKATIKKKKQNQEEAKERFLYIHRRHNNSILCIKLTLCKGIS